jgi:hypothetical protein
MRPIICMALALVIATSARAGPLQSGLLPGQRPGPYTALVSVGPQRGQLHCFICETADRPAVIVFARSFSNALGKLVRGIDRVAAENKTTELRAWLTFLNNDQAAFDAKVVDWGRDQAVRGVPLSIFEDITGPPAYRLHKDADVTVLLAVKQKVVRNFSYHAGELDDARVAEVLDAVKALVKGGTK